MAQISALVLFIVGVCTLAFLTYWWWPGVLSWIAGGTLVAVLALVYFLVRGMVVA